MLYKDTEFNYVLEEYPAFISVAVMTYPNECNFGEIGCIQLTFPDCGPSLQEGQGRNLSS